MKNILIGIAVLVLIGGGYALTKSDIFQDVRGDQENVPLVNTYWKLTELNGETFSLPQGMTKEPHFVLQIDNNLMNGFAGCNRISGNYILVGKKLTFPDNIAMTRMACPAGMDIEQAYANALKSTTGWHINGTHLQLRDKNGKTVAEFEQTLMQ